MKKIISVLFIILIAFSLIGCSSYTSSYKAIMLITSQDSDSAEMSFSSFEGTKVFTMRSDDFDGVIEYKASIADGSAIVSIDCDGTKTELFKVNAGETVRSSAPVGKGTVYIIIETIGKCKNGSFEFDIDD